MTSADDLRKLRVRKLRRAERSLERARTLLDDAFDDIGNDRRNRRTLRVRELEAEVAAMRKTLETS